MWGFFVRIALSLVFSAISAYLSYRKPTVPDPGTLDELGNPRAEEGSEIKKIFGTVTVGDPQVVWFGDFLTSPITTRGPRRYGLFGPKSRIVTGYQYSLGIHFVPCLGPVDYLNRIRIDKRIAFVGNSSGGTIQICKPNLFGASDREGGVTGVVDVMMGRPDQTANAYLASRTDGPQPAYRGVTSLVLRQGYIGNQPNLRPWEFRLGRIETVDPGYNGGSQWLPEKAALFQKYSVFEGEPQYLHIAIDVSGSMAGSRIANAKAAVVSLLRTLAGQEVPVGLGSAGVGISNRAGRRLDSIRVCAWSSGPVSSITKINATEADFDEMVDFVNALTALGGTDFGSAFTDAQAFFNLTDICRIRRMLFITDGAPTAGLATAQSIYQSFQNVSVTGISIDIGITPELESVTDRATRVSGGAASEILNAFGSIFAEFDMNPAHILREVLLSPDTGGSGVDADAGTSWVDAANTLFDEGFGLSLAWSNTSDRGEFKREIERHIDARSFIDRRTGLWEIKLIRDDYDVEDLYVFDRSNVISWRNINFPELNTLPNQLVVVWNDPDKDEATSLTISNPARIRMNGSRVISEKVEYKGIQRADLASRVAARDLNARSAPLMSGEFITTYLPPDLNLGSPVLLNNPRLKIFNRVVRITEIEDGNIGDHSAVVRFIEDRFSLGADPVLEIEIPAAPPAFPEAPLARFAEEAPRYVAALQLGVENVDTLPDQTVGFTHLGAVSPSSISIDVNAWIDEGTGFEEQGTFPFVPGGTTLSALPRQANLDKVVVSSREDLTTLTADSLAWLDGEHVVVKTVVAGNTATETDYWWPGEASPANAYTLTLGRGALDTSPIAHPVGSGFVAYSSNPFMDDDQLPSAQTVLVRMQTITSRGVLDFEFTPEDSFTTSQRFNRPYPPGNLQVGASYADQVLSFPVAVTWAHRDRIAQTATGTEDHLDADIGPEVGVTYRVRLISYNAAGAELAVNFTETGITGTSKTVAIGDLTTPLGSTVDRLDVEVTSFRSGIESYTSPRITLFALLAPTEVELEFVP